MNYQKIYDKIIENRKHNIPDGYKEHHHIVPRCLGGTDDRSNLVYLTAREHFICHYLLTKIYTERSSEWYKMNHAFMIMKANALNHTRYYNSRLYDSCRIAFSKVMSTEQSGEKNSQYGSRWIHNIQSRKNKKIPKTDPLPVGWHEGRKIKWNVKKNNCKVCGVEYQPKTKELFCSNECKLKSTDPFIGREKEFLTLYKKHSSMNAALKEMGYPGAISHYYKWAKRVLDTHPDSRS